MKKKLIVGVVIASLLALNFCLICNADVVEVNINALDLAISKEQWDEEGKVQTQSEGINITILNHFTKIEIIFKEVFGRDVKVNIKIPKEYISTSELGVVRTESDVSLIWRTQRDYTTISFKMHAFQIVTLTISKGDILYGRMKKAVHNWFGYIEYNGDATGDEESIIVFVNKEEPEFDIDNKHAIVQYKTDFFGWYYPVSDTSSDDIYYYVDDLGDQYRIVTHFKGNSSADIKIHCFSGASEGFFNIDTVKGAIARSWLSLQIGMKKFIMDIFGSNTPSYE